MINTTIYDLMFFSWNPSLPSPKFSLLYLNKKGRSWGIVSLHRWNQKLMLLLPQTTAPSAARMVILRPIATRKMGIHRALKIRMLKILMAGKYAHIVEGMVILLIFATKSMVIHLDTSSLKVILSIMLRLIKKQKVILCRARLTRISDYPNNSTKL